MIGDEWVVACRGLAAEPAEVRLGLAHVCVECRHPTKPAEGLEAMKRWWLDKFSLEELQAWPPL